MSQWQGWSSKHGWSGNVWKWTDQGNGWSVGDASAATGGVWHDDAAVAGKGTYAGTGAQAWTAVAGSSADQQAPAAQAWPGHQIAEAGAGAQGLPGSQTADAGAGAQGLLGNQTAVADTNFAEAVIFNKAFFDEFEMDKTQSYKWHNAALKWFREMLEREDRTSMTFSNTHAHPVAELVHDEKGPLFHFNEDDGNTTPWRWQEMVAHLDEYSMQMVLQGLPDDVGRLDFESTALKVSDRSRGLVSCRIQRIDKYDHARHHAAKAKAKAAPQNMLLRWDFVVVTEDGTEVFLHPNYSNTKIECSKHMATPDHEIPRTGLGGTSGPGTFQYFQNKAVQHLLRFKVPAKGKGKGKGGAIMDRPAS